MDPMELQRAMKEAADLKLPGAVCRTPEPEITRYELRRGPYLIQFSNDYLAIQVILPEPVDPEDPMDTEARVYAGPRGWLANGPWQQHIPHLLSDLCREIATAREVERHRQSAEQAAERLRRQSRFEAARRAVEQAMAKGG